MRAIAQSESGCRVDAKGDSTLTYELNGRTYGYSVSVLQVRILPSREACDSYDLATNVRCAYAIWKNGGYSPWTMYCNGSYTKFMQ